MTQFSQYTLDNAPQESKASLEETKKSFGFVPNLQSFMAESPALLDSYTAVWNIFSKKLVLTRLNSRWY